jgi:cytochrome P450
MTIGEASPLQSSPPDEGEAAETDFDHHDVALLGDRPEDVYRSLRQLGVARSTKHGGFWVLTRYEDVYRAAQDWATFSSAQGMTLPRVSLDAMPFVPIDTDPPNQTMYRHLLQPFFSPPSVARLEPTVREFVQQQVRALVQRGEGDLVAELAEPVPMLVIFELLGVPEGDRDDLAKWAHMMAHPGDDQDVALEGATEVLVYMAQFLEQRKEDPGEGLVGRLVTAEFEGRRLSDDEILSFLFLLPGAGYDTTASALGDMFLYFGRHPERWAALREDPTLIPSAVEELLRRESPVVATARTVTEDCRFAGHDMVAGQKVLLVLAAANLDEAEFADPEQCDFARQANRHFAFGTGVHRCLGSHLARMEIRVVLEETLRHVESYRLVLDSPIMTVGHIRGVRELPVELTLREQNGRTGEP